MAKMILTKINFSQLKCRVQENGAWPSAAFFFALAYFVIVMSSMSALTKSELLTNTLQKVEPYEAAPEKTQMDFQLIKDWHLFGNPGATLSEYKLQEGESQKTNLPIKLLGVYFLPNQDRNSYAIIENEANEQKKYHQGDEVPGGATLQAITKEQVILLRNQQPESLSMDRERTGLLFITK